jgi:hypothetical protein
VAFLFFVLFLLAGGTAAILAKQCQAEQARANTFRLSGEEARADARAEAVRADDAADWAKHYRRRFIREGGVPTAGEPSWLQRDL